jgi:hypothetical protein
MEWRHYPLRHPRQVGARAVLARAGNGLNCAPTDRSAPKDKIAPANTVAPDAGEGWGHPPAGPLQSGLRNRASMSEILGGSMNDGFTQADLTTRK